MRLIDADTLRDEWLEAIGEFTANEVLNSIDDIPTVPQEMSAREYSQQRIRMCNAYGYCSVNCPLHNVEAGCREFEPITKEAEDIVEAWAREHPEERSEE